MNRDLRRDLYAVAAATLLVVTAALVGVAVPPGVTGGPPRPSGGLDSAILAGLLSAHRSDVILARRRLCTAGRGRRVEHRRARPRSARPRGMAGHGPGR